jgi:hypothetical protein
MTHQTNQVLFNYISVGDVIMNTAVDLSFLNDFFDQSDQPNNVQANVKQEVQDGYYFVDVIHVKMTESKKNKTPQLMWVLQIAEGDHKDIVLYKYNTITNSVDSVNQLKTDLQLCGAILTNPNLLNDKDFLSQIVGTRLQVLVQNNEYGKNTYFQKRIEH